MPIRLAIFALLPLLCLLSPRADAANDFTVGGYYVCEDWAVKRLPPEAIDFSIYNRVYLAFLRPDANGTVAQAKNEIFARVAEAAHRTAAEAAQGKAAHGTAVEATLGKAAQSTAERDGGAQGRGVQNGAQVLVSVGGGGYKLFGKIMQDEKTASSLADAIAACVRENKLDGADIDWEFPEDEAEGAGFRRLLQAVRERFDAMGKADGRKYFLSAAVGGKDWNCKWLDVSALDWVNVMTYDLSGWNGQPAGHHAPLFARPENLPSGSCSEMVGYWLKRGVAKERLHFGLPYYARGFSVYAKFSAPAERAEVKFGAGAGTWTLNWREVVPLIAQGWTREFDAASKSAFYTAPDGNSFLGCDDPETIALKTAWVLEQGLGGVFVWSLQGDHPLPPEQSLGAAVAKAVKNAK